MFAANIAEFFSFGWKAKTSDDLFIDLLKQHHWDLWQDAIDTKCVLCCPISPSIGDDLTRDFFTTHLLFPERRPGDYVTLNGQRLQLVGNDMICGDGFLEQRKVKVITVDEISRGSGGEKLLLYRLSRPLVGGIFVPEDSDEISIQVMHKYIAILHSFPEAESIFNTLSIYIREVNTLGKLSDDGFSKIRPSLQASMHAQWHKITDRLCRTGTICLGLGSDSETSRQIIGQIMESFLLSSVAETVYPWLTRQLYCHLSEISQVIMACKSCTQSDLSIRPEFQCGHSEAVKVLCTLNTANTPVDKLLVLKKTIGIVHESVDKNVRQKFAGVELELSTDDLVLLIIWIIIRAYPTYALLPVDLHFISEYHFVSSSRSHLGFTLCHFQVALMWFVDRVSCCMSDDDKEDRAEDISGLRTAAQGGEADQSSSSPHELKLQLPICEIPTATETLDRRSSPTVQIMSVQQEVDVDQLQGKIVRQLDDDFAMYKGDEEVQMTASPVPFRRGSPNDKPANELYRNDLYSDNCHDSSLAPAVIAMPSKICREALIAIKEYSSVMQKRHTRIKSSKIRAHSSPDHSNGAAITSGGTKIILLGDESRSCVFSDDDDNNNDDDDDDDDGEGSSIDSQSFTIISDCSNKPGKIISVTGGYGYFAACNVDGNCYTWGEPDCGRLGRGVAAELDSSVSTSVPTMVCNLGEGVRIVQVSCGKGHMLAVSDKGDVFAWGDNRCAQLGIVSSSQKTADLIESASGKIEKSPKKDKPNLKLGAMLANTMANKDLSVVMACGPVLLDALASVCVVAVACGAYHSLCLTKTGVVYSWGRASNGRLGQFADGKSVPDHAVGRPTPMKSTWFQRRRPPSAKTISSALSCESFRAESPRPTSPPAPGPLAAALLSTSAAISSPSLTRNTNCNNQLKSPTSTSPFSPISDSSPTPGGGERGGGGGGGGGKVCGIAAGFSHSVVVTATGEVFSWGCGSHGRLGHGSHCDEYFPKQIRALSSENVAVRSVAAGCAHTLFLTDDGLLFGCGHNARKQLSCSVISKTRDPDCKFDKSCVLVPQPIEGTLLAPAGSAGEGEENENCFLTRVSCGDHHSAALGSNGALYVWGQFVDKRIMVTGNNTGSGNNSITDLSEILSSNVAMMACCGNRIIAAV